MPHVDQHSPSPLPTSSDLPALLEIIQKDAGTYSQKAVSLASNLLQGHQDGQGFNPQTLRELHSGLVQRTTRFNDLQHPIIVTPDKAIGLNEIGQQRAKVLSEMVQRLQPFLPPDVPSPLSIRDIRL